MAKIKLDTVRQTYIFMWYGKGEENIKYIFNRSISWTNINFTKLQPILDLLGINSLKNMLDLIDDINDDINELNRKWEYDDKVFKLLEVHSEWENYRKNDQQMINKRKEELAKKYNAVIRKDEIIDEDIINEIEKSLNINTKKKIQDFIIELHNRIDDYFKNIYEPYIKRFDILKAEIEESEIKLAENRDKLRKQNYVLNQLEHKINNKIYKTQINLF